MKRLFIVLSIVMAFSLVGCGENSETSTTAVTTVTIQQDADIPAIGRSFINLVNNLTDVSLSSKDDLNSCMQFYLRLSEEIKNIDGVKASYATLSGKMDQYRTLYVKQQVVDRDNNIATVFRQAVSAFPSAEYITLDNYAQISNAEEIYDDLSAEGKTIVATDFSKLQSAKAKYNQLLTLDAEAYKIAYFVAKVGAKYQNATSLAHSDSEYISDLRDLYNSLTNASKQDSSVIAAYDKYEEMDTTVTLLVQEQERIDEFLDEVYALPGFSDLRYQNAAQLAQINSCYTTYESLTVGQKQNSAVVNAYAQLGSTKTAFDNIKEPYNISLCTLLNFHNVPLTTTYNTPVTALQTEYGYTDATLKENMTIYLNIYIEGGARQEAPIYCMDITEKKTITPGEVFDKMRELSDQAGYERIVSGEAYCFTYKIITKNSDYGDSYYSEFFSRMRVNF